jgi:hypothetical protein
MKWCCRSTRRDPGRESAAQTHLTEELAERARIGALTFPIAADALARQPVQDPVPILVAGHNERLGVWGASRAES